MLLWVDRQRARVLWGSVPGWGAPGPQADPRPAAPVASEMKACQSTPLLSGSFSDSASTPSAPQMIQFNFVHTDSHFLQEASLDLGGLASSCHRRRSFLEASTRGLLVTALQPSLSLSYQRGLSRPARTE